MKKRNFINSIIYILIVCVCFSFAAISIPTDQKDLKKNHKFENLQIISRFGKTLLPENGRRFFLKATIKSILATVGPIARSGLMLTIPEINDYKTYLNFHEKDGKIEVICNLFNKNDIWKYSVLINKDLEIINMSTLDAENTDVKEKQKPPYSDFEYSPAPPDFAYPGDVYVFTVGDKVFVRAGIGAILSADDLEKVKEGAPDGHPIKGMGLDEFDINSIRDNDILTVMEKFMLSNVPVQKKMDMSDISSGRLKYFYFQDLIQVQDEKFPVNHMIFTAAKMLKDLKKKHQNKVLEAYVIGSYGWGNYTEKCDFDICIVTERLVENPQALKNYFNTKTGLHLEIHNYSKKDLENAREIVAYAKNNYKNHKEIRKYLNTLVKDPGREIVNAVQLARVILGKKVALISDAHDVTKYLGETQAVKHHDVEDVPESIDQKLSNMEKIRLEVLLKSFEDMELDAVKTDKVVSLFSRFYILSDLELMELLQDFLYISNIQQKKQLEGISGEKILMMAALKLFSKNQVDLSKNEVFDELSIVADSFMPYINSDPYFIVEILKSLYEEKMSNRVDRGFTLNFSESNFLKANVKKVVDSSSGTINIVKYGANYSVDGIMSVVREVLDYLNNNQIEEKFQIRIVSVDNNYSNLLRVQKQLNSVLEKTYEDIPISCSIVYGDIANKKSREVLFKMKKADIALLRFNEQLVDLNEVDQEKVLKQVENTVNDNGLMIFKEKMNGKELTFFKDAGVRNETVIDERSDSDHREKDAFVAAPTSKEIIDKMLLIRKVEEAHKQYYLKDIAHEEGLLMSFLEVLMSSIVYDNIVLVLDEDMIGPIKNDIQRILREVQKEFGPKRIKLIFSRSEDFNTAIENYAGVSNYKVFIFSEDERVETDENNVFVSLVKKEDILYEYYFPIFEIITITLAEYLNAGSYQMVPSDIKNRNILSIKKINDKLIFELLPEPEKLDKGKLLDRFKAFKRALTSV